MRILLIIPSLEPGGAERQLVALANGLFGRGHEVAVAVLGQGGALGCSLQGPKAVLLGKRSRLDNPRTLVRLAALYRSFSPQVCHGFLPTSNVLAALLRPLFPRVPLVMGMRAGATDFGLYPYGMAGRALRTLEAYASRLASGVVTNSQIGLEDCLRRGISAHLCRIVHNGIDTEAFRPDREAGLAKRAVWGVAPSDILIGMPARLDPIKDHPTFFRAAVLLAATTPQLRFVCIGGGQQAEVERLGRLAGELGLEGRLVLLGNEDDMASAYNALDVACLPSLSEGFPNVLGEAMACGTPCVATDTGEASAILGETGVLVARRDPDALARALRRQIDRLEREGWTLREACRSRIVNTFSVERMVKRTEALLLALIERRS